MNQSAQKAEQEFQLDVIYPEVNVVDLQVVQFFKTINLKSYRFPVPSDKTRKGIVFYIHGYGAYSNRDAGIAKALAE